MSSAILPPNATKLERAIADVIAVRAAIKSAADSIAVAKHVTRPSSFLPFLHHEYGLQELSPYLPNGYELIDKGRVWQTLRGTKPAIDLALTWLGMTASLDEAWTGRRFWNAFTLIFEALPANDAPLLERIEGVADLSTPQRSRFRRGVHLYDVRALEADRSRLDHAQLDFSSGVKATGGTRHFPEAAIWSFGRTHERAHSYTEAEGLALGNWADASGEALPWTGLTWPWLEWSTPWLAEPAVERAAFLAGWFLSRRLYLVLRDAAGEPIGYRRAKAVQRVGSVWQGVYAFNGATASPAPGGTQLYVEALTQFEDADGVTAREASLLVDPVLATSVKPGRLWLNPGDLSGGVEFATHEINVPLRRTVRERFKIMVTF